MEKEMKEMKEEESRTGCARVAPVHQATDLTDEVANGIFCGQFRRITILRKKWQVPAGPF